jgi:hypothetical protein
MIPTLRLLWKEGFGDNDAFLDMFFATAFDPNRCRVAFLDNEANTEIASVLYWFDCALEGQKIAYVYAVTTTKDFRGQGACHMLLKDTHQHLKSLGYTGVVLVPGSDALVSLYEGCEYELTTKRSRIECTAMDMDIEIREIKKDEYATLRHKFLPKQAVIQENENLDFLSAQAKFYTGKKRFPLHSSSLDKTPQGEEFLLAGSIENDNLYGIELLGDTTLAPGIVYALGCKDATIFSPGKDEPFAMYHPLTTDSTPPAYFGFAFN